MDLAMHLYSLLKDIDISKFIWNYYTKNFKQGWTMHEAHSHNAIEIICVLDGAGYIRFNSEVIKLVKKNVLLIPSSRRHLFYVEMNSACELVDIAFDFDQLCDIKSKSMWAEKTENSYAVFQEALFYDKGYVKVSDNSSIAECMKRIVIDLERKEMDYELLVKAEIIELFIRLSREISTNKKQCNSIKNEHVNNALDFINHSLSLELTPETISSAVHISCDYLKHIFKDCTGNSVMEYVTQKRLELAKQLLTYTNIKISEVSLEAGISNFQHFSTLFKKYTGMTPSQYRKISQLNNYETSRYGEVYDAKTKKL